MKTVKISFIIIFLVIFSNYGYGQRKRNPAAYYNIEVECMGTGMDGTQLIKVWGYGKKPDDAIEQAKKNGVQAVMFKGITAGRPGCMLRPLITEPGAEQQYQDYFAAFFKDKGKYLNFVNVSNDGSIDPKDRLKAGKQYKIGLLVSVSHTALRKELEAAGIIKPLGQGF